MSRLPAKSSWLVVFVLAFLTIGCLALVFHWS